MPNKNDVIIWLMRSFGDNTRTSDAQLYIRKTQTGFSVRYVDKQLSTDNVLHFNTFISLADYMSLFVSNVVTDRDQFGHFETLQYSVPGFPSVVVKCSDLENQTVYTTMMKCIDFYLYHYRV
jgi:hypothetical protein